MKNNLFIVMILIVALYLLAGCGAKAEEKQSEETNASMSQQEETIEESSSMENSGEETASEIMEPEATENYAGESDKQELMGELDSTNATETTEHEDSIWDNTCSEETTNPQITEDNEEDENPWLIIIS